MDLFGFDDTQGHKNTRQYVSGTINAAAMFSAYSGPGVSLCVVATQMGEAGISRAMSHVKRGGRLLIDSGAYEFRNQPQAMPWKGIIETYRALAEVGGSKISVVLPDVVGNQSASLDVLAKWGPLIADAADQAELLLPLQHGKMNQAEYVINAQKVVGKDISGVAIPMVAGGFDGQDFCELATLRDHYARRVHFLGVSWGSNKHKQWMRALHSFWPEAQTSCDSAVWRPEVGEGKAITEARLNGMVQELWQAGDLLADLKHESPAVFADLLSEAAVTLKLDAEDPEHISIIENSPVFEGFVADWLRQIVKMQFLPAGGLGASWTRDGHRDWAIEQPWFQTSIDTIDEITPSEAEKEREQKTEVWRNRLETLLGDKLTAA